MQVTVGELYSALMKLQTTYPRTAEGREAVHTAIPEISRILGSSKAHIVLTGQEAELISQFLPQKRQSNTLHAGENTANAEWGRNS